MECSKLLTMLPTPAYGALKLDGATHSLGFATPKPEPCHIFFRFSGRSRHDPQGESTPTLGAMALQRTLAALDAAQAQATSLTVMLNGDANTPEHRAWFMSQFAPHISRTHVTVVPNGNRESFVAQRRLVMASVQGERTVVFLVEEDYLHTADMLPQVLSFFRAYNPCVVVPYDYPDRYAYDDAYTRHFYARNVVLKGTGNHWRTVDSTTVTYAARLHVFRDVLRIRGSKGMPGPLYFFHDYKESLFLGQHH